MLLALKPSSANAGIAAQVLQLKFESKELKKNRPLKQSRAARLRAVAEERKAQRGEKREAVEKELEAMKTDV